jgi:hypothetical protein
LSRSKSQTLIVFECQEQNKKISIIKSGYKLLAKKIILLIKNLQKFMFKQLELTRLGKIGHE